MDLNHLHLRVRDSEASREFYARWFGFRERIRHGAILFLRNEQGFDLALAPADGPLELPRGFHFGFRQPDAGAVRALRAAMQSANVPLPGELYDEPDLISFRCADPDGYSIEIYWE